MVRVFKIVFAINLGVSLFVYLLFPSLRPMFIEEDGLVENLAAVFFLLAGVVGLVLLPRQRGKQGLKFLLLMQGLGFLGFLDEVSFGARILNFSVPTLWGYRLDGAHDVFMITKRSIERNMSFSMVCLLVAVFGLTARLISKRWSQIKASVAELVRDRPPYRMFLVFLALLATSILLDLGIIHGKILSLLEESFEMNAALALVFAAFLAGHCRPEQKTECVSASV